MMREPPRPGELCLVIPPAIDAGRMVTAVRILASGFGHEPIWLVDPPVRCRCVPHDGWPEYPGTTSHVDQSLLLAIRPGPADETIDADAQAVC